MAVSVNLSHWSTIEPFLNAVQTGWITGEDKARIAAYDVYDAIYWTSPKSFQITLRGQEGDPLYIPSGRKIVESAHRYMAKGPRVVANPLVGTDAERTAALAAFDEFVRRERFFSKFSANKRDGLKRGDWCWHILADPSLPEGRRLSIFPLHPGNYFPEYLNGDPNTIIAVHLVEPVAPINDKAAVAKLTYRKETGVGGPSPILVSFDYFEADKWGQPETDMEQGNSISVPTVYYDEDGDRQYGNPSYSDRPLPEQITSIPVYHVPNAYETDFPWGSSEMRGLESLMRAVNQAATDEDITLALEGLGLYVTTAGQPVDDEGEPAPWELGPARVVEIPEDTKFERVNGNASMQPYQDHLRYLHEQINSITNENDVSSGAIDVQVAESGIALAIKMDPLFSRMDEKEIIVSEVHAQLLNDLTKMWFPAYEDVETFMPVSLGFSYAERLPVNKSKYLDDLVKLANVQPPVISRAEVRRKLESIGWEFTEGTKLMEEILTEQEAFAAIQADAVAARVDQEVENLNEDDNEDDANTDTE